MRDRTADLLRARQALSQLSYSPIYMQSNNIYVINDQIISYRGRKWRRLAFLNESLSNKDKEGFWWVRVDLNHRPHPYQGCALTS